MEKQNYNVDFLTYLSNNENKEQNNLYNFAVDTLVFSAKVQIWHWSCNSGFHHERLENIYNILREFSDELVEITLSMEQKFNITTKNYTINNEPFELQKALTKLSNYIAELLNIKNEYSTKISLDSLISDTISKLEKEVGLLKNFS